MSRQDQMSEVRSRMEGTNSPGTEHITHTMALEEQHSTQAPIDAKRPPMEFDSNSERVENETSQ